MLANVNYKNTPYLGEGFYYRVFKLDDRRVFKKFQSYWFSFKKIYTFKRKNGAAFSSAVIGAHRSRRKEEIALEIIKSKLEILPKEFFAYPEFVSGLDYTQARVGIVGDILEKIDFEKGKNIIDQYIELQKKFWSYQIHDTTFKLQPNYGIDAIHGVVCVDFGEFVYTKEEAIRSIDGARWSKRASYKQWQDSDLKNYYTDMMKQNMIVEMLNQHWGKIGV